MDLILWEFRKYNIEYNRKTRVIEINKKIPVKDFIELKKLLKKTSREITDIRVYGETRARLYEKLL